MQPILEETKPANVVDSKVIIPQLKFAKEMMALIRQKYLTLSFVTLRPSPYRPKPKKRKRP